ncbi:MAG: hypothetical protein P8163_19035, partial [Candidatus Thiodiazotropha sp.]
MERVFHQREDWFEVGIVPQIRRRTTIGILLIALCIAAWLYLRSWVLLAIVALVVTERIFEFAHIPKTKQIISSMNIRVTENGLAFRA